MRRSQKNEALKKAAKESGTPCPQSDLMRAPKGPRAAFELALGSTCGAKVHLLTPEPYVFKPISKVAPIS